MHRDNALWAHKIVCLSIFCHKRFLKICIEVYEKTNRHGLEIASALQISLRTSLRQTRTLTLTTTELAHGLSSFIGELGSGR